MKKLFIVLGIAASVTACNNAADSADNTKDSLDSAASERKDMIDSSADVRKDMIDSTTEAKKDMADSLQKGADSTKR
jgi:hypothetical protein